MTHDTSRSIANLLRKAWLGKRTLASIDLSEKVNERLNRAHARVVSISVGDLPRQGLGDARLVGDRLPSSRAGGAQALRQMTEN